MPAQAPFDRMILTAASYEFPQLLFDQLIDGGVIVAPIGRTKGTLQLAVGKKEGNVLHLRYIGRVSFVLLDTPNMEDGLSEHKLKRDHMK